jgi:hypothetical protein
MEGVLENPGDVDDLRNKISLFVNNQGHAGKNRRRKQEGDSNQFMEAYL